jgi:protein phosphatase PTC7
MEKLGPANRSGTFVVGSTEQRSNLAKLTRREQHLEENAQKNKVLCFHAKAFQQPHPTKAAKGAEDADATLASPMLLAVADGVTHMEDYGIDASELPQELLGAIAEQSFSQLVPDQQTEEYRGPIEMIQNAFRATHSYGSTTILTACMDNSTKIHGRLHPMIAVCSIGDCEILLLRRDTNRILKPIWHSEMQRIDGDAQAPLQLLRVDETINLDYDESVAEEVIASGSAVHCVSAFEGDIVVLGSDGVFDNLFIEDILAICDELIEPTPFGMHFEPADIRILGEVAQRIVFSAHSKTQRGPLGFRQTPIGPGGKADDTSCVVAQVVEWTEDHKEAWKQIRQQRMWRNVFHCGMGNAFHDHYDNGESTEYVMEESAPCNPCGI